MQTFISSFTDTFTRVTFFLSLQNVKGNPKIKFPYDENFCLKKKNTCLKHYLINRHSPTKNANFLHIHCCGVFSHLIKTDQVRNCKKTNPNLTNWIGRTRSKGPWSETVFPKAGFVHVSLKPHLPGCGILGMASHPYRNQGKDVPSGGRIAIALWSGSPEL